MKYYSTETRGFYDSSIHTDLPPDVVEITDETHTYLLNGQSTGKMITTDSNGNPMLGDALPAVVLEKISPTAEELMAQLQIIQAQILELSKTT